MHAVGTTKHILVIILEKYNKIFILLQQKPVYKFEKFYT